MIKAEHNTKSVADSTIHSKMEEAKLALVLEHLIELPDPEEELFIQQSQNLETFYPFPRLPIELRNKIWQLALPGPRHVNIEIAFCSDRPGGTCSPFRHREEFVAPPIALSINRESRQETLRKYQVLYPYDFYTNLVLSRSYRVCNKKLAPIFIDPTVDTVYITHNSIQHVEYRFHFWLEHLASHAPELVKSIHTLEIRGIDYEWDYWQSNLDILASSVRDTWASNRDTCEPVSFMWFAGLSKLYITISSHASQNLETKASISFNERCVRDIRRWLDGHKGNFVDRNIPEVVVRSWQPLSRTALD